MTIIKKIAGVILLSGLMATVLAQVSPNVRLNSVGFLPDYPKKATILGDATTFTVKNADDNSVVYPVAGTGTVSSSFRNDDTNENLHIAVFSDFKTPGKYYLDVDGIGRSADFTIGDNVFIEPYRVMMLGMFLWRCGTAVDATYDDIRYNHAACHTNAAGMCFLQGGTVNTTPGPFGQITVGSCNITQSTRDGSGGWHDAGDYGKYVVNSGVSVGLMLKAWERYGYALDKVSPIAVTTPNAYPSGIPAFLSEVKYNLDWVAKMQYDGGQVSHKLTGILHAGTVLPQNDTPAQYFAPGGTESAASFVGMMAQGYRIYKDYASTTAAAADWLAKAKVSYEWLSNNPNYARPSITAFRSGTYNTSTTDCGTACRHSNYDLDKRKWAAIEMWEATGEAQYLTDFEQLANVSHFGSELEWGELDGVNPLAYITYLTSSKPGRNPTLVNSVKEQLFKLADALVDSSGAHAYGRTFGSANYYWGNHGSLTATTYILNAAYMLTGEKKYREAGHEVINHIFGRNYYNRSFVTGVGHNPPVNTHDRRSTAHPTSGQWPGYLVGGPHNGSSFCSGLNATCWRDIQEDYFTNEIAINWNASMIHALAGFLPSAITEPPPAPALESKTHNSVTLTPNAVYEFSKDRETWQKSNEFIGLTPETAYTFYQRAAATVTANASAPSAPLAVTTNDPASVNTPQREIPSVKETNPDKDNLNKPQSVTINEFTAGPNPVSRSSGAVNFFWQGKGIHNATLSIYDASGNIVRKIKIRDNSAGNFERRPVGSWNLTNSRGRSVSDGNYAVKGTITTKDGKKEKVNIVLGVK